MDPNNTVPQGPQVVQPASPVAPPVPPQPVPVQPTPPAPQPVMPAAPQPSMPQAVPPMTEMPPSPLPPLPPTAPLVPTASVVTPKKKGGFLGKFMIFLVLLLLIGGGAGGAYYYFNVMNKPASEPSETESQEETQEEAPVEQTEEVSESFIAIPDTEIATAPETVNYTDDVYKFSIDYLSSWDFACQNCGAIPEASTSAWTVLEMKTFDYSVDSENKIMRGARLTIKASEDEIPAGAGYSNSTYNGITGKLNLDPSKPTQGFIYEDTDTGLFMQLEWKSTTAKDRSDQELQTILKSFKKI